MADVSRRDLLKLSGVAVGVAALGSTMGGCSSDGSAGADPAQQNSLLAGLEPYTPGTESLAADEMRITFLGTSCIPMVSQSAVSVFVELGNGDCFVFDLGTGTMIKYWAMKTNMDKLCKVFLAHLHADHMGDLPFILGFGPSYGRLQPMYVWGPGDSGFVWESPDGNAANNRGPYQDGIKAYCEAVMKMTVWHNESQSFQPTSRNDYAVPRPFDPTKSLRKDSYDLVPIELAWKNTGKDALGTPNNDNIAYDYNGVKITHFPAVHTRAASVSYKLEWNGMSMIYCGDTLPNQYMIDNAKSGVDVLIHEIVMPPDVWVSKMGVNPSEHPSAVQQAQDIQDSSHTPQKAYGYILDQIKRNGKAPRLAVGTHFQATDDTISAALSDIRKWYPEGDVTIASDTMVLNVKTNSPIRKRRGVISSYAWPQNNPDANPPDKVDTPKYWKYQIPGDKTSPKIADPTAQLDPDQLKSVIDKSLYTAK